MYTTISVGTRVRVERDETRYPSRGTWPRFRGKTGTVVEINEDRKRPHLTEYGVVFTKVSVPSSPNARRALRWKATDVFWFKAYELCATGSERRSDAGSTRSRCGDTGEAPGTPRNEVAHACR